VGRGERVIDDPPFGGPGTRGVEINNGNDKSRRCSFGAGELVGVGQNFLRRGGVKRNGRVGSTENPAQKPEGGKKRDGLLNRGDEGIITLTRKSKNRK